MIILCPEHALIFFSSAEVLWVWSFNKDPNRFCTMHGSDLPWEITEKT